MYNLFFVYYIFLSYKLIFFKKRKLTSFLTPLIKELNYYINNKLQFYLYQKYYLKENMIKKSN